MLLMLVLIGAAVIVYVSFMSLLVQFSLDYRTLLDFFNLFTLFIFGFIFSSEI